MTLTVPANRTLTVPQADDTGGRAARPQFETPQTGEAVAAFGQALRGLGDRMEAERLQLEMGRLQIGITRDLGDLRRRYEKADPDSLDAGWPSDLAALKAAYLQGADGRPRVDPKLRGRWELAFDDLAERHAAALGVRAQVARVVGRAATLHDLGEVTATEAAQSDPDTRDDLYAAHSAALAEAAARGELAQDTAAARVRDIEDRAEAEAAAAAVAEDPEGFVIGLDEGAWRHFGRAQAEEWRRRAEGAQRAAQDRTERAAEIADRAASRKLAQGLDQTIGVLARGGVSASEALIDSPEAAATHPDLVARARRARWLRDHGRPIGQMSPAEMAEYAASLRADPAARATGLRPWEFVETRLADSRKALSRDPIAWAQDAGLPVPDLSDAIGGDADRLVSALEARADFAGWMTERGYGAGARLLSDEERRAVAARLAAAPDDEPGLARAVVARFGEGAAGILDQLGIDAATRTLALAGGDPALAGPARAAASARKAGDAAALSGFLADAARRPAPDRLAMARMLRAEDPVLADAVLVAGEDSGLARTVALGPGPDRRPREFPEVAAIAGEDAAAFARAMDGAGAPDVARLAVARFGPPEAAAALDRALDDDTADALMADTDLPAAARRAVRALRAPEPRLDAADTIAERLATDPNAARLARARGYVASSPDAVAEMGRALAAVDAAPADRRPQILAQQVEEARARSREAAGRPLYYGGGPLSPDGLKAAARRIVQARREGRIDEATYTAQADLIRGLLETFDD